MAIRTQGLSIMCGRYVTPEQAEIERDYANVLPWWRSPALGLPNYDARPRSELPVIKRHGETEVELSSALWTLLPRRLGSVSSWTYSTINLQSEKLDAPRSMARQHFKAGRCLVPMKGFYEWPEMADGEKVRAYIYPKDEGVWLAAGLASAYETASGERGLSFGIFTCPANEPMRKLHNRGKNKHRMPVFIQFDDAYDWIFGSTELARTMLEPLKDESMCAHLVMRNAGNQPEQTTQTAPIPWDSLS